MTRSINITNPISKRPKREFWQSIY